MAPLAWLTPSTEEEAVAALSSTDGGPAVAVAGSTDLLLDVEEGRVEARRLVSLRRLPWKTIRWEGDALLIGSTLPLARLESDPTVRRRHPGLWQAVRAVGSVALRHRATLGGNLGRASPASDLLPILLALDAEVELVGPTGHRRETVDGLVRASRSTSLGPGELIRSVRLPEPRPSAFLWQRVRPANDISQISVAVAYSHRADRWLTAVGGLVPRPRRLPPEVGTIVGPRVEEEAVRRFASAAAAWAPFQTDRRATERYRRQVLAVLLRRALLTAGRPAPEPA